MEIENAYQTKTRIISNLLDWELVSAPFPFSLKPAEREKQTSNTWGKKTFRAFVASTIRIIFGYFYFKKDENFVLSQIGVCS